MARTKSAPLLVNAEVNNAKTGLLSKMFNSKKKLQKSGDKRATATAGDSLGEEDEEQEQTGEDT